MVGAGRVCCITAPFLLSLGCLICLVLIFLAGTMERNHTTGDLYFLKINLENLTLNAAADALGADTANDLTVLGGALEAAKQALGMQDHYTIYLRNYCGWNGNDLYSNCTDPQSYFWFNPIRVWGLDSTGVPVEDFLDKSLRDGLKTYEGASKAMFVLYVAALSATSFTLLVGISAIFSRWGSFFTTFFAGAATLTTLVASVLATATFIIVKNVLNHQLKDDYGVTSSIDSHTLAVSWLASAFAVAAGFFWLLSVCCCSGRSPYHKDAYGGRGFGGRGRTKAEKTPYTYERVGSPYLGPRDNQSVPLANFGPSGQSHQHQHQHQHQAESAYEPFRPQHV